MASQQDMVGGGLSSGMPIRALASHFSSSDRHGRPRLTGPRNPPVQLSACLSARKPALRLASRLRNDNGFAET